MQQLQPENSFYNVFHLLHLPFAADTAILRRTLTEIVQRHEILRTRFVLRNDGPVQQVSAHGQIPLTEIDLRSVVPAEKQQQLDRTAIDQASTAFDLSGDHLARAALVHLDANASAILFTFHHIVTDAWSLQLFCQELTILYEAFANHQYAPLAPLPIQYGDYAVWQRNHLDDETIDTYLDFWRNHLSDLRPLQLPIQKARPPKPGYRGRVKAFAVPQPVYTRLKRISGKHNATLFITLLSAFKVLLFRYTGQEDIVVGCPFSGRAYAEVEKVIGFFVNTLVLRSRFSGLHSFDQLLGIVKQVSIDAFTHGELPFEKLVEELHPDRNLGRNPLFQVVFQLLSSKDKEGSTPAPPTGAAGGHAKFDITLTMSEEAGGLRGYFEYDTDLFAAQSIERMTSHFLNLLQSIAEDSSASIGRLGLLSPGETDHLLNDFNRHTRIFDHQGWVHELISRQAQSSPEAIALFSDDEQYNYAWLEASSNQLAHLLIEKNIGQEQLVAVALPRSAAMVAVHLAILKAGAAFVPLDMAYPRERLAMMLDDLQPAAVITSNELAIPLPETGAPQWLIQDLLRDAGGKSSAPPRVTLLPAHRCYVMYTSGSTGKPKGVELQHGGFLNLVQWNKEAYHITADDRSLQMATPAYDAYIYEVFPALAAGASVFVVDDVARQSPKELRSNLIEHHITYAFLSTAMGEAVMEQPWPEQTSLRIMATGGEKLSRLPAREPAFRYLNFYGPTENTVMSTYGPVPFDGSVPSIGHALANVNLYVLDALLNPVPVGVDGELYIGGANVGRGYLQRPGLTADKFIPDPFAKSMGSRLYRTGDRVRWRIDGNLDFTGRTDYQVKLRGFRIELEEIERNLLRHPAVREAAVIMQRPSPENSGSLTGYVALQAGAAIDTAHLRDWLRDRLPAFMIPAAIISLAELPKSFNGKTDRKALQQLVLQSAKTKSPLSETGASSILEHKLAAMWAELLPAADITADRNFFEMGAHSLMMAQVQHRIAQILQREVPMVVLFQYPTIRSLSKHLEETPGDQRAAQQTEDRASKQRHAFQSQRWNKRST